jgi:phenylalanine-4-hydroxylase
MMADSEIDQHTWSVLFDGYTERLHSSGCKEVICGFEKLGIGRRVARITDMSERMYELCGWRLTAADGLLPEETFIRLLLDRIYPVVANMRRPDEIDFAEFPDTFHDMLGHLPLLVEPAYRRFLTFYSEAVARHISSPRVVHAFARLYWYTAETGLVMEDGREKILGAAILTSRAESENAKSMQTEKKPMDLDAVLSTDYDTFRLQPWYFVLDSFEDLLTMAEDLEARARSL